MVSDMGSSNDSDKASSLLSLSGPRQWLGKYEDFISNNASSVAQIESGLRSLTYIIPGRFHEAELASESLNSGVQLLSLYHDTLFAKAFTRIPSQVSPSIPSPHSRYTKFWYHKSKSYRRVALLLQTVQYTELLWEMLAKRRGDRVRWKVVVMIEAVKALCRLLLLKLTRSRPIVSPPLPGREVPLPKPEVEGETAQEDETMFEPGQSNAADQGWTMPRTGLNLPSLPESHEITEYLLKKVLTADDIKTPAQLLHRLTALRSQAAEVAWILRPLIYALLLQRFQNDRKSWTPWLVGLGIDLGSRHLAKSALSEEVAGGLRGLTGLEKEELRKRGWGLSWWAMRGAFYERFTKEAVGGVVRRLKGKPLLDMVGTFVEDYEFLWSEYYFSTA